MSQPESLPTFKEFRRRIGFVPIRELWGELRYDVPVYLFAYLLSLAAYYVFLSPGVSAADALVKKSGLERIISPGILIVALIYLLKNRRFFGVIEELARSLKDAPTWILVVFMLYGLGCCASERYLPAWAWLGLVTAGLFMAGFLEKANDLGQAYAWRAEPHVWVGCEVRSDEKK